MKLIGFLAFCLFFYSCTSLKHPPSQKKDPGHHILKTDKKAMKENMKLRKEHAEKTKKRREELDFFSQKNDAGLLKKKKGK
jgi:hypothetical protein